LDWAEAEEEMRRNARRNRSMMAALGIQTKEQVYNE
jgi:hypothetical protein